MLIRLKDLIDLNIITDLTPNNLRHDNFNNKIYALLNTRTFWIKIKDGILSYGIDNQQYKNLQIKEIKDLETEIICRFMQRIYDSLGPEGGGMIKPHTTLTNDKRTFYMTQTLTNLIQKYDITIKYPPCNIDFDKLLNK